MPQGQLALRREQAIDLLEELTEPTSPRAPPTNLTITWHPTLGLV
jgi:hypothetical protein